MRDSADLSRAVEALVVLEPRFTGVLAAHGLPALRAAPLGLESLLRIVTDQLISLQAGAAIWRRLAAELGSFEPHTVLAQPEDALRNLGLSAAKARCFHAAAEAFATGRFDEGEIARLSDSELFRRLTDIRGVGPWTANLYLLTAIRSADAWPAADLALQEAARDLFGLAARPSTGELERLAEAWRPWRSAAALLLWSHYRGLKGLPQA